MLPKVILHMGVSADGRYDWGISTDSPYYEIIPSLNTDADLSGSGTIQRAFFPEDPEKVFPNEYGNRKLTRPLLAVIDSQGKILNWHLIKKQPWWSAHISFCSRSTPQDHIDYLQEQKVDYYLTGADRVDLKKALEVLSARYGVQAVRVDSGGILNGVLLRAGLVDEVNIVVHPELVGGMTPKSMFVAPDLTSNEGVIPLKLLRAETIRDKYVWLKYMVIK